MTPDIFANTKISSAMTPSEGNQIGVSKWQFRLPTYQTYMNLIWFQLHAKDVLATGTDPYTSLELPGRFDVTLDLSIHQTYVYVLFGIIWTFTWIWPIILKDDEDIHLKNTWRWVCVNGEKLSKYLK